MAYDEGVPDGPITTFEDRIKALLERVAQLPTSPEPEYKQRMGFINAITYLLSLAERGAEVTPAGHAIIKPAVLRFARTHDYPPHVARNLHIYQDSKPGIEALCAWMDQHYAGVDSTLAQHIRKLVSAIDFYAPDAAVPGRQQSL